MYQSQLKPEFKKIYLNNNITNSTTLINATENYALEIDYFKPTANYRRGLNVLGLVVFCITFGVVLAQMEERGKVMVSFFEALNEVSIRIIHLVMWSDKFKQRT